MLSNAYFLAKFRFDTAENEPAKNLQNFRKMHFRKMHFRKMHLVQMGWFVSGTKWSSGASGKAKYAPCWQTWGPPGKSRLRGRRTWSGRTFASARARFRAFRAVRTLVERFDIESFSDFHPNEQTLEGSFSSVSRPTFATKY